MGAGSQTPGAPFLTRFLREKWGFCLWAAGTPSEPRSLPLGWEISSHSFRSPPKLPPGAPFLTRFLREKWGFCLWAAGAPSEPRSLRLGWEISAHSFRSPPKLPPGAPFLTRFLREKWGFCLRAAGAPSEPSSLRLGREISAHSVRSPAKLPQPPNAQRIMPLRQPHAVFIPHQIAMVVRWHSQSQRTKQKNLPRRRFQ